MTQQLSPQQIEPTLSQSPLLDEQLNKRIKRLGIVLNLLHDTYSILSPFLYEIRSPIFEDEYANIKKDLIAGYIEDIINFRTEIIELLIYIFDNQKPELQEILKLNNLSNSSAIMKLMEEGNPINRYYFFANLLPLGTDIMFITQLDNAFSISKEVLIKQYSFLKPRETLKLKPFLFGSFDENL